jgi:hypothetical protein
MALQLLRRSIETGLKPGKLVMLINDFHIKQGQDSLVPSCSSKMT